jgi:hypothetical protein
MCDDIMVVSDVFDFSLILNLMVDGIEWGGESDLFKRHFTDF